MAARSGSTAGRTPSEFDSDAEAAISITARVASFLEASDPGERLQAGRAGARIVDRARQVQALQQKLFSAFRLPIAFVHGHAHLGNTFRDPAGKPGFCDFQAMGRGPYIWGSPISLQGPWILRIAASPNWTFYRYIS